MMFFKIKAWNAISSYSHTKEDWLAWSKGESLSEKELNVSFLPLASRRRLSKVARYCFAAAWPLMKQTQEKCPIVFVSYDGEANRSIELWLEYSKEETVSPTSFALSVHNAIVGQWSLMRHDMSESVAISASCNGLENAIVEACGLLYEGASQVLLVQLENPLTLDIANVEKAPFPFALALLLESGDEVSLEYKADISSSHLSLNYAVSSSEDKPSLRYYDSALSWIKHQLKDHKEWQEQAPHGVWHWRQKG